MKIRERIAAKAVEIYEADIAAKREQAARLGWTEPLPHKEMWQARIMAKADIEVGDNLKAWADGERARIAAGGKPRRHITLGQGR